MTIGLTQRPRTTITNLQVSESLLQTQLDHNLWSTKRLLEHCEAMPLEAYRTRVDIGLGALDRTLAHLVDALFYFADVFNGRSYHQRMVVKNALTPRDLIKPLELADGALRDALASYLAMRSFTDRLEFPAGSGEFVPAGVAVAQIFDHASHHRAQCIHMLKRLRALDGLTVDPLRWAGILPD